MVKDVDIDTKIAAYQFTVTTKYQHSLFRPLKKDYNPDIIFTSGIETKKLFQKKYNCPIKILGSNKYKKISKIKKNQNSNFLVIPEAFYSETYNLLNYTIDIAKILPDYKFIFRCHPMMKTEEFKNNINQQNNIIFSNNHIDDDISSCKYVLFRGSAAVFEAVNRGLLPIYLDINNEPNINPFKDFFLKNYNVVKDKDIYKILDHYKINQLNKKVVKYSNNYFTKFNTSIIKSLL